MSEPLTKVERKRKDSEDCEELLLNKKEITIDRSLLYLNRTMMPKNLKPVIVELTDEMELNLVASVKVDHTAELKIRQQKKKRQKRRHQEEKQRKEEEKKQRGEEETRQHKEKQRKLITQKTNEEIIPEKLTTETAHFYSTPVPGVPDLANMSLEAELAHNLEYVWELDHLCNGPGHCAGECRDRLCY
ncbi:hypothetical protein B566_EDAN017901, partial [Ephemera danica]